MADVETTDNGLSDEQIEELIQEAEQRLRRKRQPSVPVESEDILTFEENTSEKPTRVRIPRIEHGLDLKGYLQDQKGVIRVKPELLANKQQQNLADRLRCLEAEQKPTKKEVCSSKFTCLQPFHEENLPKFS